MLISLVARLSCGHDLTIRKIREDKVPAVAKCPVCLQMHSVDRYVDDRPLRIT